MQAATEIYDGEATLNFFDKENLPKELRNSNAWEQQKLGSMHCSGKGKTRTMAHLFCGAKGKFPSAAEEPCQKTHHCQQSLSKHWSPSCKKIAGITCPSPKTVCDVTGRI